MTSTGRPNSTFPRRESRRAFITNATSKLSVHGADRHLSVAVDGDQKWLGDFQVMDALGFLEEGYYGGLQRYPYHNPVKGGLNWSGEGRGCNEVRGWFAIDSITYDGDTLTAIDLRFEQECEDSGAVLHGKMHWDVNDGTEPPGPVVPVPAGLWAAPGGITPATGSYVYLESEVGDYIGQGQTYLYTPDNSTLQASSEGAYFSIAVNADQHWSGRFTGMDFLARLEVGYCGDLQRYLFNNPVKGGLTWMGDGRNCGTLTGWFAVDNVTYDGDALTAIDLRFEQHCEDAGPALRGQIHWDSGDAAGGAGPSAEPAGLWEPPPGATPDSGNFVFLESQSGDLVGGGYWAAYRTYLYTLFDSMIAVSETGARLDIDLDGDEHWEGRFQGMDSLGRLETGFYGDLQKYPFHDPAVGGLSWFGEGRACASLAGWFIIDSITHEGDALSSIEMRFEQRCDGAPPLNGIIRWRADDHTIARGPVMPPPAGLWQPPADVVPATGNYVYMDSTFGDFVGDGHTYLYTSADSVIAVGLSDLLLSVDVDADEKWTGKFEGMNSISRIEAGYYPDLLRWPFNNPAKGALDWYGEGRGCNELWGWFAVDSVSYDGDTLTAITLRFEQYCDGGPALHGAIRWDANDPIRPPGPVNPPPAGLWAPAAGVTPASGNYVYLTSDDGEWVGRGQDYLYTDANSTIVVDSPAAGMTVDVDGWRSRFQAMNSLDFLEAGYYGDLHRYPFHNPAKGGLSWSGNGHGCIIVDGWFVVDDVSYDGAALASISLRFEQRCDGDPPLLHGEIHWSQ